MVIVGFVLLALAVAAAIVLIAQNPDAMMSFKALGDTYTVHAYWVFVGGMVVLAVAAIGLSIMRSGAAHSARVRRERRDLAAENARLNDRVADQPVATQPVVQQPVAGQPVATQPVTVDSTGEPVAEETTSANHHLWGRRTHRTV